MGELSDDMFNAKTDVKQQLAVEFRSKSTDPLVKQRGICMLKDCAVRKIYLTLRDCQNRVKAKPYTAETCHQECVDLMESLDRCVAQKAFVKFI